MLLGPDGYRDPLTVRSFYVFNKHIRGDWGKLMFK